MLSALSRNLAMVADPVTADVVHAHTWYTHFAALLIRLRIRHSAGRDRPLARAAATLEARAARRRVRRQQLGRAHGAGVGRRGRSPSAARRARTCCGCSRWLPERIHVIHNGIDPDFYHPDPATDALERHGIDPSVPYVLFVGRITRQKGIVHLVRAIRHLEPGIGVVLCAGQPDTPEIGREMEAGVRAAQAERPNVVWIGEMVSREEARQLYSHAAVFCCPSVYEPFGIINLEAAACGTPVVASAVGGIPEVVVDGETGLLVPVELRVDDPMSPVDADRFELNLAGAINALMADPTTREVMGRAARRRAIERFSWSAIAQTTVDLYRMLVAD